MLLACGEAADTTRVLDSGGEDSEPGGCVPGAEVCNQRDDDCDGDVDEDAIDAANWYLDADFDGFGAASVAACVAPVSYVAEGGDCDDENAAIHPGAPETCDTADEDCDGAVDEDAVGAPVWYLDEDADGFGGEALTACIAPASYIATGGDCDDRDADVHPLAREACGATLDLNCDEVLLSCPVEGDHEVTEAEWAISGDPELQQFGYYLATGADFENDGQVDLVVSAVAFGGSWRGEIYGVRGPLTVGGTISDLATWTLTGTDASWWIAAAEVGDLTGDGVPDVVVAENARVGPVSVVSGPIPDGVHAVDGCLIDGDVVELMQPSIALADVDGDGLDDLLLGSWTDYDSRGTANVFRGPIDGDRAVSDADIVVVPEDVGGNFGGEVLGADLDNDGLADLVAGAPRWGGIDQFGAVFVYTGLGSEVSVGAPYVEIDGVSAGGGFGGDLSVGDLDASGTRDLYVSAINAGSGFDRPGMGYLFYDGVPAGTSSAADADVQIEGTQSGAFFSRGGSVGDVNADGRDDLGLSASGEDTPGGGDGALHIFYGPVSPVNTLATDADASIYATETAGRSMGCYAHTVGRVGDLTGDGVDDLAVGAPLDTQAGPQVGVVFLWRGG